MHAGGLLSAEGRAGQPAAAPIGWRRRAVHGLAIVAGWFLFFWGWQRVLARHPDFSELRVLIVGAAVVVPVVTVSWILHNRGIHRRKGPRRHVASAELDYRVDFHGREVVADFVALAQARRVDIVADGAAKRYLAGRSTAIDAAATGNVEPAPPRQPPAAAGPHAPTDPPSRSAQPSRDDSPATP